jgi:AraC family transcriptional activator of pobA
LTARTAFTLINPQSKALAFHIYAFEDDACFEALKNYNYYSMILVTAGRGKFRADLSEYVFEPNSLLCFSIYQPFMVRAEGQFKGILINFHPDFFCIHKHQEEVACNGVLFNNIYEIPSIRLDEAEMSVLMAVTESLKAEMQNPAVAQFELLIAYLKIFLINASRIKMNQHPVADFGDKKEPFILKTLKDAIEEHFKTKHSPGDYADLLNISTKALNRMSKAHFNKTLTSLIAERIIIEAKRELYLTSKPVKAIAYELGFGDEFYFSRFFKNNAAVSPQIYRDTVGFAKGTAG